MQLNEIKKLLNRDFPMLLLDGAEDIVSDQSCRAFKNLTYNEWFFPSHFQNNPILPGSLQIEIFTQAVALPLLCEEIESSTRARFLMLAGITDARFFSPVKPGSRLDISVTITRISRGIALAKATGFVCETKVSQCLVTYKILEGESCQMK
jgi:3-hydroxyacyl-[acyl-carrier-protein] dehydratase